MKFPVIPTIRLRVDSEKVTSIVYTNLNPENAFKVIRWSHIRLGKRIPAVNAAELEKLMSSEIERARMHGIKLTKDSWVLQIDPKTNVGRAFILDFNILSRMKSKK